MEKIVKNMQIRERYFKRRNHTDRQSVASKEGQEIVSYDSVDDVTTPWDFYKHGLLQTWHLTNREQHTPEPAFDYRKVAEILKRDARLR